MAKVGYTQLRLKPQVLTTRKIVYNHTWAGVTMQKRICFLKKKIQNTNIIYDKKKLYQECLKIIFTQLKQMNKSKSLKNFNSLRVVDWPGPRTGWFPVVKALFDDWSASHMTSCEPWVHTQTHNDMSLAWKLLTVIEDMKITKVNHRGTSMKILITTNLITGVKAQSLGMCKRPNQVWAKYKKMREERENGWCPIAW